MHFHGANINIYIFRRCSPVALYDIHLESQLSRKKFQIVRPSVAPKPTNTVVVTGSNVFTSTVNVEKTLSNKYKCVAFIVKPP